MVNRIPCLSFAVALLVASAFACGSPASPGASPSDPAPAGGEPSEAGGEPSEAGDEPAVSLDGGTTPRVDGSPPTKDSGTKDSALPVSTDCSGKTFLIAKVVPMPSGYTVAGFSAFSDFLFTTQANPRKLFRHSIADVSAGMLQVLGNDSFYHPEEVIHSVAGGFPYTLSARRITEVTKNGVTTYRVRLGSDANLGDETGNLPTLDASSRITTMVRPNTPAAGATPLYVVRAGAEVYAKESSGQVWSLVASLSGSGVSAWEGLAVSSEKSRALHLFFKAMLAGGQTGIVEQRWTNALAADADAPVLVFADANAAPFGVSQDGCRLYASRQNGATIEVVIYAR